MKINYDITIPEVETAFMLFWRKYGLRRSLLLSVVYVIAIVLCADLLLSGNIVFGGIGLGLSLGMLASIWVRPFRSRKKLAEALSTMYEEKYSAVFGDEDITIETTIQTGNAPQTEQSHISENVEKAESLENSENSENPENTEQPDNAENSEQAKSQTQKSTYSLASEELYSEETDELMLLYVNRSLIYVFPKRCLHEQEIEDLRTYFASKNI